MVHGTVEHHAGRPAKHSDYASQTPIGRLFGVAGTVGPELLGNVTEGPQASGAAVHQPKFETELSWDIEALLGLVGDVPQRAAADFHGQALARIAEGGGGFRAELSRKAFTPGTEVVGATRSGILLHLAQAVVVVQALEDQIPESNERGESPLVEGLLRNSQPGGQPGRGQELAEGIKQL